MIHTSVWARCRVLLFCLVLSAVGLPIMADDPPEPGFDVEGGPTAEGRELRDMTPLTEAERKRDRSTVPRLGTTDR